MLTNSVQPAGDLGVVATSYINDNAPVIILISAFIFTVMIIGVLIKKFAGGNDVEFGLDDDELNPLD